MTRIITIPAILLLGFSSLVSEIKQPTTHIHSAINNKELELVRSGEIVFRELTTDEKPGLTYEVIGTMNASLDVLLDVLMDYEKYGEFMPSVSRVEIVEQKGDEAILNFILELPMGFSKRHRIHIALTDPGPQGHLLLWDLVEWPGLTPDETIKDSEGYWMIQEEAPNKLLVLYHVYTDPGSIPYGLKWLVEPLSRSRISEAFLETRDRAERFFAKH